MDYDKIKRLMDDMGESKLTAITIELPDGTKISMSKYDKEPQVVNNQEKKVEEVLTETEATEEMTKLENKEGKIITSPMVGTFYSKPSPTAEPYVEVGSTVKVGDTVCIVEAMKLMNEIESEYAGEVAEVLVKDGEPVEYGTPLFRIK